MAKHKKSSSKISDFLTSIILFLMSFFLLFTKTGKELFIPIEQCPSCLQLYYYLISYAILIVAIFFLVKSFDIIKEQSFLS